MLVKFIFLVPLFFIPVLVNCQCKIFDKFNEKFKNFILQLRQNAWIISAENVSGPTTTLKNSWKMYQFGSSIPKPRPHWDTILPNTCLNHASNYKYDRTSIAWQRPKSLNSSIRLPNCTLMVLFSIWLQYITCIGRLGIKRPNSLPGTKRLLKNSTKRFNEFHKTPVSCFLCGWVTFHIIVGKYH